MLVAAVVAALVLSAPDLDPRLPECRPLCASIEAAAARCGRGGPRACDPLLLACERLWPHRACGVLGRESCSEMLTAFVFTQLHSLAFGHENAKGAERTRAIRAMNLLATSPVTLDGDTAETWGLIVRRAYLFSRHGALSEKELFSGLVAVSPSRKVRASSTLAPQGAFRYAAALAVDGDPATAWCSAHGTSGAEPWIEISFKPPNGKRLTSFYVVPGYGRDEATFRRNDRVLSLRVSTCGAVDEGTEVFVPEEGDPANGAKDVELRPYDLPHVGTSGHCFRLTILKVAPGSSSDADTCISEIVPYWE